MTDRAANSGQWFEPTYFVPSVGVSKGQKRLCSSDANASPSYSESEVAKGWKPERPEDYTCDKPVPMGYCVYPCSRKLDFLTLRPQRHFTQCMSHISYSRCATQPSAQTLHCSTALQWKLPNPDDVKNVIPLARALSESSDLIVTTRKHRIFS